MIAGQQDGGGVIIFLLCRHQQLNTKKKNNNKVPGTDDMLHVSRAFWAASATMMLLRSHVVTFVNETARYFKEQILTTAHQICIICTIQTILQKKEQQSKTKTNVPNAAHAAGVRPSRVR